MSFNKLIFFGNVSTGNRFINNVPCKLILPESFNNKPILIMNPDMEQTKIFQSTPHFKIEGEIKNMAEEVTGSISASETYIDKFKTKHIGPNITRTKIKSKPVDLHIIQHLTSKNGPKSSEIVFWISPNEYINPAMIQTTSYDGSVEFERIRNVSYTSNTGETFKFDKHFATKKIDKDKLLQWNHLVCMTHVNMYASDILNIKNGPFSKLEDILLMVSLASRIRTGCLGWQASDNQDICRYFRGNYSFPDGKAEPSIGEGLISRTDLMEFISKSCDKIALLDNKSSIKGAIHTLFQGSKTTIEASILAMFSGFEKILLDYRKKNGLEYCINPDKWPEIKNGIKKHLKTTTIPKLEKEERALIYQKLDELNRVSLSTVYQIFCSHYNIDTSDLWPIFSSNTMIDISSIRNRIIHGESIEKLGFDSLIVAHCALKWTLERIILSLLEWPIDKSDISRDYLTKHSALYPTMLSEQQRMTELMHSNE